MLGSAAEPGVMYLTMLDLYKSMDEIKEEKVCSTAVSYLEVSWQYHFFGLINSIEKSFYKKFHYPFKLFYQAEIFFMNILI